MRKIDESAYLASKAVLAAYKVYCKPYVQKNGWTCIPADAPRFVHNGETIDTDGINAHSTNVELFELARDKPAKFSAYVTDGKGQLSLTTWTGETVGRVVYRGPWHCNNFGGRWRAIDVETDWRQDYFGREYDFTRSLI